MRRLRAFATPAQPAFQRPLIFKDAGTAPSESSAMGIGRRSVWQGRRQKPGGGPIVKQNRQA